MFTPPVSRLQATLLALGIASFAGIACATPPPDGNELGPAVASSTLGSMSGGTDTTTNGISTDGSVSDAQASHVNTGMNAIEANSFQGAAGLPTVIQNSGNNVLIQNATIINVRLVQ
ncbi:hypothetical protein FHW69_002012 [Luteibacter sp. Sphag1AF]|uniref:hypothetical protein n=1 Tax=Luteibacter sp. Sphag1AF TaxID=2587031 RepID=UPI00178FC134|nr:hypothetical protein [Luteibacter sp. Sphag1AF]MBB3227389.1 hypothetical protein [Luteibacter sp. Sphag1AF]